MLTVCDSPQMDFILVVLVLIAVGVLIYTLTHKEEHSTHESVTPAYTNPGAWVRHGKRDGSVEWVRGQHRVIVVGEQAKTFDPNARQTDVPSEAGPEARSVWVEHYLEPRAIYMHYRKASGETSERNLWVGGKMRSEAGELYWVAYDNGALKTFRCDRVLSMHPITNISQMGSNKAAATRFPNFLDKPYRMQDFWRTNPESFDFDNPVRVSIVRDESALNIAQACRNADALQRLSDCLLDGQPAGFLVNGEPCILVHTLGTKRFHVFTRRNAKTKKFSLGYYHFDPWDGFWNGPHPPHDLTIRGMVYDIMHGVDPTGDRFDFTLSTGPSMRDPAHARLPLSARPPWPPLPDPARATP